VVWGVLVQWFEHYNRAGPHRALRLRAPIARSDPVLTAGLVTCTERLGGLLREYAREQAPAAPLEPPADLPIP